MCSTLAVSTSVGSASHTARLSRRTCCEPPKTNSTGVCGSSPSAARAAAWSWPAKERMGVPVRKHATRQPRARLGKGHRERAGQPRRRAHAPTRHEVALPHQRRDAQRGRGRDDRDGDVAAGREHGVGPAPRELGQRLRVRGAQSDGIEHGVDRPINRAQRSEREQLERVALCRDDVRFETAPPTQPAEFRLRRPLAQAARDGQRRIDVAAGTTGGDQNPHR